MNADLILTTSVPAMIEARETIREKVMGAFVLLNESMSLEKTASMEQYSVLESFMSSGRGYYFTLSNPGESTDSAMKQVDAKFWRSLLDQSGIRAFMSARRQEDLDDQISRAATPPFEMDAIKATFADLYERRANMMEEGIIDLFRRLSWDYRTNNPLRIGRKIIVSHVIDSYGSVSSNTADVLDDLIRILSVYDGKPIPEHRNGMYHAMTEGPMRVRSEVETEYFHMKVYKKGTGHIVFHDKALPLLDQCNRVIARHYPHALAAMDGRD